MSTPVMVPAALPHRDHDAVLTLNVHYFEAADLMLKNYKKLSEKRERQGHLSGGELSKFRIYFTAWLGFLAVTAEGFKKLGIRKLVSEARPSAFAEMVPRVDSLRSHLKLHDDALRKFRNSVFHLRDSAEDLRRFFDSQPNRLQWAEDLHAEFKQLFSDYRVLCEVSYILEDRKDESSMVRKRKQRTAA